MPRAPIVGVILAAGQSSRMGRSKPLLRVPPGNDTFLSRAVAALREGGIEQIAVIGRARDEPLRAELSRIDPSVPYLVNPAPERGQLSSALTGVAYAESRAAAGMLMLPVDIPLVRPSTVATLLEAFALGQAAVVRPVHEGRHGHPVIFAASMFAELKSADMSVGAKAVLHKYAEAVCNIEVTDAGITRDVDAPQDYRDLFNTDPH